MDICDIKKSFSCTESRVKAITTPKTPILSPKFPAYSNLIHPNRLSTKRKSEVNLLYTKFKLLSISGYFSMLFLFYPCLHENYFYFQVMYHCVITLELVAISEAVVLYSTFFC